MVDAAWRNRTLAKEHVGADTSGAWLTPAGQLHASAHASWQLHLYAEAVAFYPLPVHANGTAHALKARVTEAQVTHRVRRHKDHFVTRGCRR